MEKARSELGWAELQIITAPAGPRWAGTWQPRGCNSWHSRGLGPILPSLLAVDHEMEELRAQLAPVGHLKVRLMGAVWDGPL